MRKQIIITSMAVLFLFWGCAAYDQIKKSEAVIKQCKFTLESIDADYLIEKPRVRGLSIKKAKVVIFFDLGILVDNPTEKDLSLNKIGFLINIEGKLIAEGTTSEFVNLPAGGQAIIPARINVNAINATEKLAKQLQEKQMPYAVTARFNFLAFKKNIPFPYTFKGVLNS